MGINIILFVVAQTSSLTHWWTFIYATMSLPYPSPACAFAPRPLLQPPLLVIINTAVIGVGYCCQLPSM